MHNRFAIAPRLLEVGTAVLHSSATVFDGAGDESRTRDLNLGKVALYQLSYSRVKRSAHYIDSFFRVKALALILAFSALLLEMRPGHA